MEASRQNACAMQEMERGIATERESLQRLSPEMFADLPRITFPSEHAMSRQPDMLTQYSAVAETILHYLQGLRRRVQETLRTLKEEDYGEARVREVKEQVRCSLLSVQKYDDQQVKFAELVRSGKMNDPTAPYAFAQWLRARETLSQILTTANQKLQDIVQRRITALSESIGEKSAADVLSEYMGRAPLPEEQGNDGEHNGKQRGKRGRRRKRNRSTITQREKSKEEEAQNGIMRGGDFPPAEDDIWSMVEDARSAYPYPLGALLKVQRVKSNSGIGREYMGKLAAGDYLLQFEGATMIANPHVGRPIREYGTWKTVIGGMEGLRIRSFLKRNSGE